MRPNSQDSTSIIPKDIPTGPYYCNLDNIRLDLQNKETGEYICPKCSTSYFPRLGEKVKRANKFETPSGPSQPILSLVDDSSTQASSVYKQPKIPKSFDNIHVVYGLFPQN